MEDNDDQLTIEYMQVPKRQFDELMELVSKLQETRETIHDVSQHMFKALKEIADGADDPVTIATKAVFYATVMSTDWSNVIGKD
jgi:hypothetical protein